MTALSQPNQGARSWAQTPHRVATGGRATLDPPTFLHRIPQLGGAGEDILEGFQPSIPTTPPAPFGGKAAALAERRVSSLADGGRFCVRPGLNMRHALGPLPSVGL